MAGWSRSGAGGGPLLAALLAAGAAAQGRPAPTVLVANDTARPRHEVARVSVPFPAGACRSLAELKLQDRPTAWRVLCRWPDGSIRAAQARFPLGLEPGETANLPLVSGQAETKPFARHPWVAAARVPEGLLTETADPDGVPYLWTPIGPGEVLEECALERTVRWRGHHRHPDPKAGLGRDFLSLTLYVTESALSPVVELDLVLGNDYRGADRPADPADPELHPLGDTALARFDVLSLGLPLLFPAAARHGVSGPFLDEHRRARWRLLAGTYLGDGQCRRWRALALADDPAAPAAARELARATWEAMAAAPLRPLADAATWHASGALSLYGGPAYPPPDWAGRVAGEIAAWGGAAHFGPFGSFGDVKETGTTGTPRNTPCSPEWVHAVQTSRGRLLDLLEGKAWQQACRPCHLWGLRVEPGDGLFLWSGLPFSVFGGRAISPETLGRKALHDRDPWPRLRRGVERPWPGPHGWNAYDSEHWTTDLLFDCWLATGDWWCRDELRHLGECAMGLFRPETFSTRWPQAARAEGWLAHSLVQVWLATGDERIRRFLAHRIREVLAPAIRPDAPWRTPFLQRDYPGTRFPPDHRFYMPWQHGPLILGMLAAWRYLGEERALELCAAAARAVDHARVRDVRHPRFGPVREGLRYYVPVEVGGRLVAPDAFDADPAIGIHFGDSPLGGAHEFLALPLWLLAREERADEETRRLAGEVAALLAAAHRARPAGRWGKWTFLIPDGP